uniref:uridine diphosphate glucose pyrophosphatase NUDT14 isoform X2 n=1 Tax=Pristiophorus japonicus TaxID=55135 RepID=UPI00398EEC3A
MEALSEVKLGPCRDSPYLRPLRIHYTQNGTRKHWDFMQTHDSVSILIFNTTRQSFVLVKQFRPAVYMCECARRGIMPTVDTASKDCSPQSLVAGELLPASAGVTYELCAGIVDKSDLSLQEIAKEEVLEECGYNVSVGNLQKITSYRPRWLQQEGTEAYRRGTNRHTPTVCAGEPSAADYWAAGGECRGHRRS